MRVKNKVAIVTGASSGIGLATARLLTKEGAKVALVSRSKKKLEHLSKELPGSLVRPTDMTDEKEVKKMVQVVVRHFGRIDILINNAGRGYDASIEKIEPQKFRDLFQLDVVGPLVAMQCVIPFMRKQKGGAIINISSGTSLMTLPHMSAYSSLKRALNGISLTAREELAKDKISVSVVYPYITLTDFDKNMMGEDSYIETPHEDNNLPPADKAEYIAEKILQGIETREAEIYAHKWMKDLRK